MKSLAIVCPFKGLPNVVRVGWRQIASDTRKTVKAPGFYKKGSFRSPRPVNAEFRYVILSPAIDVHSLKHSIKSFADNCAWGAEIEPDVILKPITESLPIVERNLRVFEEVQLRRLGDYS